MSPCWDWVTCWAQKPGAAATSRSRAPIRALTGSPVARSMIEGGRRKIANRISPDAGFVTLAEIDNQTAVVQRGVERQPKTAR